MNLSQLPSDSLEGLKFVPQNGRSSGGNYWISEHAQVNSALSFFQETCVQNYLHSAEIFVARIEAFCLRGASLPA